MESKNHNGFGLTENQQTISYASPSSNVHPKAENSVEDTSRKELSPTDSSEFSQKKSRNIFKKRLFWIGFSVAISALILVGGFGYLYYLPNQPDRVWNTGLIRSGKAINTIVENKTTTENLNAIKKSDINIDIDAKSKDLLFIGDVSFKFEPSKGGLVANVSTKGSNQEQKLSLEALSEVQDGNILPDTYVKLAGISSFGLDALFPEINSYEGKWIYIGHEYLAKYGLRDTNSSQDISSSEDMSQLVKAVNETTQEYIFTSNPNKAVIVKREFIGKEQVDGTSTYHYKAGIDIDHAKDYCKILIENIYSKEATKEILNLEADELNKHKNSIINGCQNKVNDIDLNYSFDLWVDSKYKLIKKMRFTDNDIDGFVDIGQNYTGGDVLTLFVISKDNKAKREIRFDVTSDLKTSSTKGSIVVKDESENGLYIKANFDAKPYTESIHIIKPDGAIPINDVLSNLGIHPVRTR